MANAAQVRKIQIMKRDAGVSEAPYRQQLRTLGVESSKDLDNAGVDAMVSWLAGQGATDTTQRRPRRQRQPAATITPDQQQLIAQLYEQLEWPELSRQMGFNKRCTRSKTSPEGRSFPQTVSDAIKIIEGLKAMLARKQLLAAQEETA
jgi:hypothetical protein